MGTYAASEGLAFSDIEELIARAVEEVHSRRVRECGDGRLRRAQSSRAEVGLRHMIGIQVFGSSRYIFPSLVKVDVCLVHTGISRCQNPFSLFTESVSLAPTLSKKQGPYRDCVIFPLPMRRSLANEGAFRSDPEQRGGDTLRSSEVWRGIPRFCFPCSC